MVTAYAFQGAGLCRAFRSGLKAAVLLLASVRVALQPRRCTQSSHSFTHSLSPADSRQQMCLVWPFQGVLQILTQLPATLNSGDVWGSQIQFTSWGKYFFANTSGLVSVGAKI